MSRSKEQLVVSISLEECLRWHLPDGAQQMSRPKKPLTRFVHLDLLVPSLEKSVAQLAFQILDLSTNGTLRQTQLIASERKAPMLCSGFERRRASLHCADKSRSLDAHANFAVRRQCLAQ